MPVLAEPILEELVVAYTDDIFSFSAFDPARLSQNWREFAEKSTTHSRDAYGKMKSAAEEATRTVESTVHSAHDGTMEIGMKAIDAMRANTEMSFAHMESLMGAKTLSEVLELQAGFVRRQAEFTVEQARVMQQAARKVADDFAKPDGRAPAKTTEPSKPA